MDGQSCSGRQRRPTVLSNCHARLQTREHSAAGKRAERKGKTFYNAMSLERDNEKKWKEGRKRV